MPCKVRPRPSLRSLTSFLARVCRASVFVLLESLKFNRSKEITLEMGVHSSAAVAEVSLAVMSSTFSHLFQICLDHHSLIHHAASLPLLRPICRRIIPGFSFSSRNDRQSGKSPQDVVLADWATKSSVVAPTGQHNVRPPGSLTDGIQGKYSHLSAQSVAVDWRR